MRRRFAAMVVLAMTTPLAAQWLSLSTPGIPRTPEGDPDLSAPAPRAADGRPDLTGLWNPTGLTGALLDTENVQGWARDQIAANARNFFVADPRFNCLPEGPGSYAVGGSRRIVQHPDFIAILNGDLTYRQIFLDGRELEADPFPTWQGYSVGRWEGDTLIVESNGYNDKTWLHHEGLPHTESLRITERYRRTHFGRIEVEIAYEDPGTFVRPVSASLELRYVADNEMLEVVCNESSKGTSHYGSEVSDAEQNVVAVDEETLAKYVGTYEGIWLGNFIVAEVTLEDGALFLERTPPYFGTGVTEVGKSRLIAQSENAFDCECGIGFVFQNEVDGVTTEVLEVHVSGAWTFERVP